jgi:superfamily II DNA or RNA helicase
VETCLQQTEDENTIFICTIQALQDIHIYDKVSYNKLKERISLVVVDEGHREPAPEWAKAVRELNKPTVLFTATPYRNDHKIFDVDKRFVFVYTHHTAVQEKYIRAVEFRDIERGDSPERFVEEVLFFYNGEFQKSKPQNIINPRVIIRCDTVDDIKVIANLLKKKGKKVVALHENFADVSKGIFRKHVSNPERVDAIFWVHQYKLIEGIDDPR